MGLHSLLSGLLGRDTTGGSDLSDLLSVSEAALELDSLGYEPITTGALCFRGEDAEAPIDAVIGAIESSGIARTARTTDDQGFCWLVLEGDVIEDVASSCQFAAEELSEQGLEDQLLAAVVAFTDGDPAYLIYQFDSGRFHPFVPTGTDERDSGTEYAIRGALDDVLPMEADPAEWYPLWPERRGRHPWE